MEQHKQTPAVRRRARGVQRITSILTAAETVFTEMGYDEATTNHIVASLNLIEPWWKTLRSLALTGRRFETWEQMEEAVKKAQYARSCHQVQSSCSFNLENSSATSFCRSF